MSSGEAFGVEMNGLHKAEGTWHLVIGDEVAHEEVGGNDGALLPHPFPLLVELATLPQYLFALVETLVPDLEHFQGKIWSQEGCSGTTYSVRRYIFRIK
jgi:hypothetical protein